MLSMHKAGRKLFFRILFLLLLLAIIHLLLTPLLHNSLLSWTSLPIETPKEWLRYKDTYYNRYCVRRNASIGAYGYASVIKQLNWFTESSEQTSANQKGPLIWYDKRRVRHNVSSDGCKYYCRFSTDLADYRKAVLAVFTLEPPATALPKLENQTWALETEESPFHMPEISTALRKNFALFLTHQADAHVTWAYGVFVAKKEPENIISSEQQIRMLQSQNAGCLPEYHTQRRGKVFALISNYWPKNYRMQYIQELAKHINVDLYGDRFRRCPRGEGCLKNLTLQYKFFLAFENSNCVDYITEKFFMNALTHRMVPVVMGAPRETYCSLAPPNSFIHVDDFSSPAELAGYLNWLNRNDTAYASYFAWITYGTIVNEPRMDCRLCGFLHQHLNDLASIPSKGFDYHYNISKWCKKL